MAPSLVPMNTILYLNQSLQNSYGNQRFVMPFCSGRRHQCQRTRDQYRQTERIFAAEFSCHPSADELRANVTVEKGAEDEALCAGVPIEAAICLQHSNQKTP